MMPLDIRAICFIFGLILCGALTVSGNAMDIIIDDEEVQECLGSLTLLAEDSMGRTLPMKLTPIHFRRRNRRKIKKTNERTKELYKFEKAKLEGDCCWKIWSRYRAGESILLSSSGAFEPGWSIRSIEIVKSCQFN